MLRSLVCVGRRVAAASSAASTSSFTLRRSTNLTITITRTIATTHIKQNDTQTPATTTTNATIQPPVDENEGRGHEKTLSATSAAWMGDGPSTQSDTNAAFSLTSSHTRFSVSMVMYGGDFERRVVGRIGETLLNVAQLNDVDQIEGACEGCMCCSTCHMILDESTFKAVGPASDDEQDLIDRSAGATDFSRLGCQVRVAKSMQGARIRIPTEFTNQMI